MPTEPSGPGLASFDRLRASCASAYRSFARLGLAGRVAWSIAALAALIAIAYFTVQPATVDFEPLYSGRRFPPDQAAQLASSLTEADITPQIADGRLLVAHARHSEAYEILRKLGQAPSSLKDLVNEVPDSSFLSSTSELQQRENRRRERLVEGAIEEIDRTLSAVVQIFRSPARGLARSAPVRVTVWLKLGEQPRISLGTIERIRWAVQAWVPDLPEDGLTLLDSTGRPYLLAGNPAVAQRSALGAREEEIRDSILQQLDWIPGVRVAVGIEAEADLDPLPALQDPPPSAPAVLSPPEPLISVNQPFDDLADEAAAESTSQAIAVNAPEPQIPTPESTGAARVLIQVPNTYYTQLAAATGRSPSLEEMHALVRETETSIRRSVEIVLPEHQRGQIVVERIFVPGPAAPPTREPALRNWSQWYKATSGTTLTIAFLGVSFAGLVLALLHRQRRRVARRQRRLSRASQAGRRRIDMAETHAPSDRVRELVRLDPAAAAGVLQRWIGAGGHDS